ncbi:MAG: hypothetical protein ACYC35_27040 [Pirellulales bacterium]
MLTPSTTTPVVTMARAAKQRIFPLHLTPIELFMLADDQPGYPMTFVIQLELSGRIDRVAFEQALLEALERHPLLRAWIQSVKGDLPCWVLAEDPQPALDWASEGTPMVCPRGEGIDLEREIGLRVWVREGADRARVMFQFHHACTDGTGAHRFIGDVLAAYGIRTAEPDKRPEFGSVAVNLLRTRKQHSLGLAATTLRGLRRVALRHAWSIMGRRPVPLAPPRNAPPEGNGVDFPGYLYVSFSRNEHQQLRDVAGRCGVTFNDLLLRDLFLTMEQWNRQQWSWHRWPKLRIMMPTDLRSGDDYEMPAANMTSYTFITRAARMCASPDDLLRSIRNETGLIKHQRSGTTFMDMLLAASNRPGLLRFLLSRNLCLATAILSNLADPSRRFTARFPRQAGRIVCGNLVLDRLTGVPPLRPKTRATFSVSQYDRRLTLGLRCDPHVFRMEDTAALLRLYEQRLRESGQLGQTASPTGDGQSPVSA